eukprot:maker-scaffold_8-snap-gene-2.15-mRNA-1 protein AED:0.00 eAED:0.00 QI:374/1/1/1/1/1/3/51/432
MSLERRVEGALYGLLIGDCFSIPMHWYYDQKKLEEAFPKLDEMGIIAPPAKHFQGGVSGFDYSGKTDILFANKKYYGKDSVEPNVHYHKTLKKGQNTHNICISRLLMRMMKQKYDQAVANGWKSGDFIETYNPLEYIEAFVEYTKTDPEKYKDDIAQLSVSNDLYLDRYVRRFFEQLDKYPPHLCAYDQRDQWSISAVDGLTMYFPMILAYVHEPEVYLVARAIEMQNLTHKSLSTSAGFCLFVPLVQKIVQHGESQDDDELEWFQKLLTEAMKTSRPPEIRGIDMFKTYAQGPDNIPKDEKWQQHMELKKEITLLEHIDGLLERVKKENLADGDVIGVDIATACYTELSTMIVCYVLRKYAHEGFSKCLRVNAKFGGHTTGRGHLLGVILGAIYGVGGEKGVPEGWINDLAAPAQVKTEIDGVVEIAKNRL